MRQDMRQENDEITCYVWHDDWHKILYRTCIQCNFKGYDSIDWHLDAFACNQAASEFNSLEELEINLQLKFPEACFKDYNAGLLDKRIKGISQETLRDYVKRHKPLL